MKTICNQTQRQSWPSSDSALTTPGSRCEALPYKFYLSVVVEIFRLPQYR